MKRGQWIAWRRWRRRRRRRKRRLVFARVVRPNTRRKICKSIQERAFCILLYAYSFSKSQKRARDLLNHSWDTLTFPRSTVTIPFDLAAQRIDLPLLNGISNTEKTRNFSLNFPLELRFQNRRSSWDEFPPFRSAISKNFLSDFVISFMVCGWSWISARRSFWNAWFPQFLQNFVDTLGKARLAREIVDIYSKDRRLPRMWIYYSMNNSGNEINILNYYGIDLSIEMHYFFAYLINTISYT